MLLSCYIYNVGKRVHGTPQNLAMKAKKLGFDCLMFGCWMDGSEGPKELGGKRIIDYMKAADDAGLRVGLWAYPNSKRVGQCMARVENVAEQYTREGRRVFEFLANCEKHMKDDADAWRSFRQQWCMIGEACNNSWCSLASYGLLDWHDGRDPDDPEDGGLPLDGKDHLFFPTLRPMFYSVGPKTAGRGIRDAVRRGWKEIGPSLPAIRRGWPKGSRAPDSLYDYTVSLKRDIELAGATMDRVAIWSWANMVASDPVAKQTRLDIRKLSEMDD